MGQYTNFDQAGYLRAVKLAIADELRHVVSNVETNMRTRLGAVQWRSVDAKYKSEALNSIKAIVHKHANSLILSIGAGGRIGEQSQAFRAIYYEYGTGSLNQSNAGKVGQNGWNMARKGRDIYQRSNGQWVDLDGNVQSQSKGASKKLKDNESVRDITPTYWFAESLNHSLSMLITSVHKAVKNVPVSAYIVIRSIQKRM